MNLESLYKEVIMEHFQNPIGRTPLKDVTCTSHGYNASCGDDYTVNVKIENDVIVDIQVNGTGCAISGAAGSMLCQVAKGKKLDEIETVITDYREMLKSGSPTAKLPGDLPVLAGVSKFPVRVKCAALPMTTMLDAISEYKQ